MAVWNKIWDEVIHADANAICARKYANVQRRIQLAYKILIPLLSGLSAFAIKYDYANAAFCSAVICCGSTIAKAVFPQVILSELDIERLSKLHTEFINYREKVEGLMERFKNDKELKDEDALKELLRLKKSITEQNAELDKLVLWIPSFIDKHITIESDRYLSAVHKNKYQE